MTVQVLVSTEPRTHYLEAVFSPDHDTGIAFDVRCRSCKRTFGGTKMDETIAGTIPMYRVVNHLHSELNKAAKSLSHECCDG